MDDYKEITKLLKPLHDIKASDELRQKVRKVLARDQRTGIARKWLFGGISLSAVASVLLLMFLPSGISAKEILTHAIDAFENTESIDMVVEVRTRPVENFRYIDINENFINHNILIASSDSILRWRIDKGERIATGNGNDIYTWIPSLNLGWHIKGSDNENVLGYLATLLKPWEILQAELDNCISNSNVEYKVNKKENEIILTIHAYPQGNFDNPYLLNTSISESESIRKYLIDADSKRLKSVAISVVSGKREVVVLRISNISYGMLSENICMLADGIRFVEFNDQPDGLKGLSAEEAASTFLNAFADWNEDIIDKMMAREIQNAIYKKHYQGASLDSIGSAFTSGLGNSVFVPYTLKLRDGTLQRHNIALQETGSGGWIVVGGL